MGINKKGANNAGFFWAALVILVVIAFSTGSIPNPFSTVDGGTTGTGSGSTGALVCGDSSFTATVGPMKEWESASTSVAGEWARVFVNGLDLGLTQDSATFTVKPGDEVDTYLGENSSIYFTAKNSFTIDSCGAFNTGEKDTDVKESQLVRGTTLTLKAFASDTGDASENGAGNETINANDIGKWRLEIQSNARQGFAPYGDTILVVDVNGTSNGFDSSKINLEGWTDSDVPGAHKIGDSDIKSRAFKHSGLKGLQTITSTLSVESGSDNPISSVLSDAGAEDAIINITLYAENWQQHSEKTDMIFGVENNVDTLAWSTTPSFYVTYA